jgi:peptidyl-prolyl cis-trans isomerase C
MRKLKVALLITTLLATATAFAQDAQPPAAEGVAPGTLIATVNGTPYTVDTFRLFMIERLQGGQQENNQAFQQQAFNEFMTLIVASQEAEKRKLQDNPDVQAAMEVQRLKVMANAGMAAMARDIEVTDEALKAAYEEVKKQAERTEYKARHILVKDEAEAKNLIAELDKKADFAELAKKHSLGPTGKNGGELDWFDASQMVKPFADAVSAMKPGTHSKEPVNTQFGWHVIELQETRVAEPPPFEDAKPQLTALVQREKLAQEMATLRDGAMVELNEEIVRVTPREGAEAPAPEETK